MNIVPSWLRQGNIRSSHENGGAQRARCLNATLQDVDLTETGTREA